MHTNADAWLTEQETTTKQVPFLTEKASFSNEVIQKGFENDFITDIKIPSIKKNNIPSGLDYSFILEEKLHKIQFRNKKENGKEMIKHLQELKNLHMSEFLKNDAVMVSESSHSDPSFLEKLYTVNSLYRHLNPQQGLEGNEKEPLTKHDYLDSSTSLDKNMKISDEYF